MQKFIANTNTAFIIDLCSSQLITEIPLQGMLKHSMHGCFPSPPLPSPHLPSKGEVAMPPVDHRGKGGLGEKNATFRHTYV